MGWKTECAVAVVSLACAGNGTAAPAANRAAHVSAQGFPTTVRDAVSESPLLHIFLTGKPRMVVKDSVEGAIRRLGRPTCQQVFTDFVDPAGHPLSVALEAWGKNPPEALAALYFVEGDGSKQCRADETTAAFTARGNRVIYVCGTRFADRFALKTTGGEILLIHELLHALGLGENPPSSARITETVWNRCRN